MILNDNHKNTVSLAVSIHSVARFSEFISEFPTNGPSNLAVKQIKNSVECIRNSKGSLIFNYSNSLGRLLHPTTTSFYRLVNIFTSESLCRGRDQALLFND